VKILIPLVIRTFPLILAIILLGNFECCGASEEFSGKRAPGFEPPDPKIAPPRVALVLGSGGHRGFAHIGVLKVLSENGIRPDLIIGSSVGAVVGALYAGGMSATEVEKLAYKLNSLEFFELRSLFGRISTGRGVQDFVNQHLQGRTIEELPVAFAAAATRVRDSSLVLFNRGDTGVAVRASAASPGEFEPVRISGEAYVDGDVASPVPIRAARRMGARVVIAVDVSAFVQETPAGVPAEWVEKDARRAMQVAAEGPAADVLIHPDIGYFAGRSEAYRRRVIAIAYRAAREQLPAVLAAVVRATEAEAAARAIKSMPKPSSATSK
jgi:NTE family protein